MNLLQKVFNLFKKPPSKDDSQVPADISTPRDCELHHIQMVEGTITLLHDSMIRSMGPNRSKYFEAQHTQFPNSNSFMLFGSTDVDMSKPRPNTTKVHYCPVCREKEREWREMHHFFELWFPEKDHLR